MRCRLRSVTSPSLRATLVVATAAVAAGFSGCSTAGPASPAQHPPAATAGSTAATSAETATPGPTPTAEATSSTALPVEPTTTNTLPPPSPPTAPAPSVAGKLTADALPVPAGWRTVARDGGEEEGFEGNGTWVHARDPRYAAQDVIGVGCAPVTRDDYTDPIAALEGNYASKRGAPGVGLALQFGDPRTAQRYFDLYRQQVQACTTKPGPVRTTMITGVDGLADHRRYDDGEWTEVGRRTGDRVILVILSDAGRKIDRAAANAIARQIR
jgi:hypothetical protein